MSLSQRVAAFATISCAILGLVSATTPGAAAQLDRTINAANPVLVPQTLVSLVQAGPQPAIATVPQSTPLDAGDSIDDGTGAYATLDAAVAAQNGEADLDQQMKCLAGAIYYEAKGEPLSGQLAVADVILNRAKSGRFASTVCGVVTQPGQFAFVRSGAVPAIPSNRDYRTAVAVAKVAMAEAWDSPAEGAMYFHARHVRPGWHRQQVAAIGNHLFYR